MFGSLNTMDKKCQKEMTIHYHPGKDQNLVLKKQKILFYNRVIPQKESGNALIYVLVAIALFAALTLTLGRQTDTSEVGALSGEKAELYASQLISYGAQAKSVIDQMLWSGSTIADLDFTLPNEAGFNTAPHIHKVYHPEGGGLNPGIIPTEIQISTALEPPSGWYMGRFNNVEWTASTGTDVILIANKISTAVCQSINVKINGSTSIPLMSAASGGLRENFIDDTYWAPGGNTDLTTSSGTPDCSDCDKQTALCIQNNAQTTNGYYVILADR